MLERAKGIEPSYEAWEASVLPLNYARQSPRSLKPPAMAGEEGLEPPTPGFGDRCSNQLSYTPTKLRSCRIARADARRRRGPVTPRSPCAASSISSIAIFETMAARAFASAGRRSPSGPLGVPASISTQHALKKADLLGNNIDRLLSLQRLGDRSAGFNRRKLSDRLGEISSRVRQYVHWLHAFSPVLRVKHSTDLAAAS